VCVCACARARVFFSYEPKDKERVFPYAIFDWSLYFEKRWFLYGAKWTQSTRYGDYALRLTFEESWCESRQGQKCVFFPKRPDWLSDPYSFLSSRHWRCSSGAKRLGREADHSPHLLPKLRMSGAISPLPPRAFMVCLRTSLPSPLLRCTASNKLISLNHDQWISFPWPASLLTIFIRAQQARSSAHSDLISLKLGVAVMSSYHKSKLQMSLQHKLHLPRFRATTEIPSHTRCLHIMRSFYVQINIDVTKKLLQPSFY